jgi:hypothetical protein
MPGLEPGMYGTITTSLSITFSPLILETGDIWVVDPAGQRVLQYTYAGAGPGVGYDAVESVEFGALYLPNSGMVEGFAVALELDGVIGVGGSGSAVVPIVPLNPASTSVTGGPAIGFGAGAGVIVTHARFKKVYPFSQAPSYLPLENLQR